MEDNNDKKKLIRRPAYENRGQILQVVKGSIETEKLKKLLLSDNKDENNKQNRIFIRKMLNFAYHVGSYEKAMDIIKDYEANNAPFKS